MPRVRILLVLLVALLVVPASAQAAKDLYVSGSGGALDGCLSADDPCTLQKALSLSANGDRVLVDGSAGPVTTPATGVSVTKSISLRSVQAGGTKPVVVGAVPSGDAVVRLTSTAVGANISGLDVRNSEDVNPGPGLQIEATGVVIQDSVVSSDTIAVNSSAVAPTVRRVIAHGGNAGAVLNGVPNGDPAVITNSVLTSDATAGSALRSTGAGTTLKAVNVTAISTGPQSRGVVAAAQVLDTSDATTVELRNSIARGIQADLVAEESFICLPAPPCEAGKLQVDHSDFVTKAGTLTEGAGNVSVDPGFVSSTDFHLAATSALRDIGVEDPLSAPVDLEGSPRKDGTGVDLGAYEYLIPLPPLNPLPPVEAATAPKDNTAPTLGVVRLSNAAFRVGPKATALAAAKRRSAKRTPVGSVVTTGVTERSTILFEIDRIITGRKSAGDCVKVKAKTLRRLKAGQKCKLTLPVEPGLERVATRPGRVSFDFSGRVGTVALPAGPYKMVVIATDAAGNRSAPQRASFTILPPKKKTKK